MRAKRSTTCSGASYRNSGMISMVSIDTTIAATMTRYTRKRESFCATVKRRQAMGLVVVDMRFTRAATTTPEEIDQRRVVDEDRAHAGRENLPQHDERDDRDQDRAHVVVVEALERREQRAADAARADDAHHRRVAQVGVELVGGKADEAREHLRHHAEREHRHE